VKGLLLVVPGDTSEEVEDFAPRLRHSRTAELVSLSLSAYLRPTTFRTLPPVQSLWIEMFPVLLGAVFSLKDLSWETGRTEVCYETRRDPLGILVNPISKVRVRPSFGVRLPWVPSLHNSKLSLCHNPARYPHR